MPTKPSPETETGQPQVYQIRLAGHLGNQWTDWFGGLAITLEDQGETLLTGPVADQAALHGLLKKVRDLGLPLISLTRVRPVRRTTARRLAQQPDSITLEETHEGSPVHILRITRRP